MRMAALCGRNCGLSSVSTACEKNEGKGALKDKGCDTPRRDKTIACVNLVCVLDNRDGSPRSP